MINWNSYEREENMILEDEAAGKITREDAAKQLLELQRDARDAAAQDRFEDAMGAAKQLLELQRDARDAAAQDRFEDAMGGGW